MPSISHGEAQELHEMIGSMNEDHPDERLRRALELAAVVVSDTDPGDTLDEWDAFGRDCDGQRRD